MLLFVIKEFYGHGTLIVLTSRANVWKMSLIWCMTCCSTRCLQISSVVAILKWKPELVKVFDLTVKFYQFQPPNLIWRVPCIKQNILTLSGASQSQKTQGFCVADFATLSDETGSRSKIFPLFIWIKEPCVRKFERLERSKRRGISQTNLTVLPIRLISHKNQRFSIFFARLLSFSFLFYFHASPPVYAFLATGLFWRLLCS